MKDCPSGWSGDGKWMYFNQHDQVWKMPVGKGSPIQVTFKGGQGGIESTDGKFLYYSKTIDEETSSLWKVPLSGGKEIQVLDSVYADNVAITDLGIYFIPNRGHRVIEFLDFGKRKIEHIASIAQTPAYGFALSPDKRWLLYTEYESLLVHDLMLVEHFR